MPEDDPAAPSSPMHLGIDLAEMTPEEMRVELAMFRAASRQSRTGAWRYDKATGVVHWSDFTAELFGFEPGATVDADTGISLFDEPGQGKIRAAFEACLTEGRSYDVMLTYRDRLGRTRSSRARGEPVRDAAGAIVGVQGAFADITAEVEAREEVERLEASLTEILNSLSDGFFILDGEWRFAFINDAACALLQRDRGDLTGANVWRMFPDAVGTRFEAMYRDVFSTGRSAAFVELFEPLGSWFEVSAHATGVGLAVYFRRINDQIEEQERLRLLSAAVAHVGEAVMIVSMPSEDGASPPIVFANGAAEALTDRREPGPTALGLAEIEGPDRRGALSDPVRRAAAEGRPQIGEAELTGPDDAAVTFAFGVAPVPDAAGRVTHAAIVGRDVTEARKVEAQVRRKERLSLLGQLSGGVSHDFNNLLAVILGNLELMDVVDDPEETAQLRREAIDAVMRGKDLNESLLAFAGRAPIRPTELDPAALVEGMRPLLRRTLPSNIALDFRLPDGAPKVTLDRSMMESCILNLVINARFALPEGGRIEIGVRAEPPGADGRAMVALSVRDDGVGIPADIVDRVFDPFVTTRTVGEGSGLGLSRVKGFVEQSGGSVTLESEEGRGTEVTLRLPVSASVEAAPEAGSEAPAPASRTCLGRVLLAEDAPAVAVTMRRLLTSLGLEVALASSAEEALALYDGAPGGFDMVVTDVVMPGVDGHELLARLRGRDASIAAIVVSGYPDAAEAPINGDPLTRVLGKPVMRTALAEAVEAVLAERDRRTG